MAWDFSASCSQGCFRLKDSLRWELVKARAAAGISG